MKATHRLSILYPRSGLPLCRFGTTEKQQRGFGETTEDGARVTCKRCLALMKKLGHYPTIGGNTKCTRSS